jgi:serine/threonine-protein kinase
MLVGQSLGPFAIDKELGSGAMGTVYRGVYAKTGQKVAIKIMLPGMGTSDRAGERFEREAAILKQFNHPNIVRMFGVGRYQGTRYYAMEYIEGEPLDKVMARRGRMSWEEVVQLGKQLCAALQHAHEKGVIHRDLKPSNLMMLEGGTLKLTDFGIAKDLDVTGLTGTNCTVGTASYMSPEQCKGERDLSHKSDLYSLGILFYELITGRKPFNAENAMDMFLLHVQGTFERPSKIVLDLPVWFDTLICQLLEKKPEQRPLDAAMVARTLDEILEKVEAQKSAGVEAAQKRRADRLDAERATVVDAADRETARLLTGKVRRRKKKPAVVPFFHKKWVQAIGLSVLLLGVLGAIFWVMQPKSPEQLYAEAEKLMSPKNSPEDWEKARNGPIKEYLDRYGGRPGPQTDKLKTWADWYDVYECGRTLETMLTRGEKVATAGPQNDAEKDVYRAAKAEQEGRLKDAHEIWEKAVEKWGKPGSGYQNWGQFAAGRLADLDRVDAAENEMYRAWEAWAGPKVVKIVDEPKYEGPKEEVFLALRYEWRGDPYAAVERFRKLREKYDGDKDNRIWHLLAVKKVTGLKAKAESLSDLKVRQGIVKATVEAVKAVGRGAEQKAQKRAVGRDIVELYEGQDGFQELLDEARKLAAGER